MKSYLLGIWNVIDPIYYSCTRLDYIKDQESECLFRVRLTRYKGRKIVLKDGTVINKNDLLLKIHLHNVKILQKLSSVNSEMKRAVYIYHMVKRSLPSLAYYVESHPRFKEIKGVIGITSLHKGARHLGFEIFPIKNGIYRTFKKATFMPINYFASNASLGEPFYLFMSKHQLIHQNLEKY